MYAHAFFSIVKSKAIPALIIAALMDQFSCPAVLGIGHDGDFLFDFHHLQTVKNSPYLSVHFESKMTPPFENKFAAVKKHLSYTSTFFGGLLHG